MSDQELRALCEDGSQGPFTLCYADSPTDEPIPADKLSQHTLVTLRDGDGFSVSDSFAREDALFFAAARTEVPRLLDENKALRQALNDARRGCASRHCAYWDPIPVGGIAKPCSCGADEHNRRIDAALAGKAGA